METTEETKPEPVKEVKAAQVKIPVTISAIKDSFRVIGDKIEISPYLKSS